MVFTAPRQVELREESLPAPAAGEVLVETICSAISAGTENLIYRGFFPRDLEMDPSIPCLRGNFEYPISYGYAAVGKIRELGEGVDKSWHGKAVFAFQPHASHFITTTDLLFPIPDTLTSESACFLPNMETAVNLVQDGAPVLGERVLILGQGVVGLLTASLLKEFPLHTLVTTDPIPLRRRSSLQIKVTDSLDPGLADFHSRLADYAREGFDLVFELSTNPSALNDAVAHTRFSGRVVVGSWYGEKPVSIDLGGTFHRSRIKLISSQVSTIAPELSARWDKPRRFATAWKELESAQPQKWITHRFPLEDAAQAYRLLEENPQETIQVIFTY
jgi:2-desacetyl-2-hydroxyethyl bacteriochlorophyllide A dehydrogenase